MARPGSSSGSRWRPAALALVLITAGGPAWGQAPSDSAPTLARAEALIRARAFDRAAPMLRQLLNVDPANRRVKEMLAFALESLGDIEGERHLRSALAAEFPDDPRIQADYGRVLERSGDERGALRAYRRARELSADDTTAELDAAIRRMTGRSALEIGTPLAVMSDPVATASRVQAGAAVPLGAHRHVALLGTHHAARGKSAAGATTTADALALSFVQRGGAGATWQVGPRLHVVSRGGARTDVGVGGALAGRTPCGPLLEVEWSAEAAVPWDEAPVAVLRGGRTTGAEGRLYLHGFSRRLLLQGAVRRRALSILAPDPGATRRHEVWQSLAVAGADVVVWRQPGAAVRGEMLDEALVAPATLSSAVTLAYRHYDVSTRTTPEFTAIIGLVPRGSVHEGSVTATFAAPRGDLGLQLGTGLARDSARQAQVWRAGGSLTWAPIPSTRFALGYEEATEVATGLVGQRRTGWLSFHVDL